MLSKETTPSAIVRYLDQYVIGQEDAKKTLAVAVYSHYRKIGWAQAEQAALAKSNVLLIGSSGTGKTLTCETLSRLLEVPFVTADATSLAQTKYVNEEIEAILLRLIDKAGGDEVALRVDDFRALDGGNRAGTDGGDDAVLDEHPRIL